MMIIAYFFCIYDAIGYMKLRFCAIERIALAYMYQELLCFAVNYFIHYIYIAMCAILHSYLCQHFY